MAPLRNAHCCGMEFLDISPYTLTFYRVLYWLQAVAANLVICSQTCSRKALTKAKYCFILKVYCFSRLSHRRELRPVPLVRAKLLFAKLGSQAELHFHQCPAILFCGSEAQIRKVSVDTTHKYRKGILGDLSLYSRISLADVRLAEKR